MAGGFACSFGNRGHEMFEAVSKWLLDLSSIK